MARDASWGTFIGRLQAAEDCCKDGSRDRWKKSEPILKNLQDSSEDRFSFIFPKENFNFETEGIDHFISTVAGDILRNPSIEDIEVEDFSFNDRKLFDYFPGPNVGIDGLYNNILKESLNKIERPILAFSVKPRIGLDIEDHCSLFTNAAKGGFDIVEDDERLIDPPSCPFKERVDKISKIQKDYATVYSVNITGSLKNALDRLEYAYKNELKMVKFDVLSGGFETLRQIALCIRDNYNSDIAITVYPDAYGNFRSLSRKFILKMSRICGADIIYAGSPQWARYEQKGGSMVSSIEGIYTRHQWLSENYEGSSHIFKDTLPTITNDQHLSRAEFITVLFRREHKHFKYAFFVGGGLSGFPGSLIDAAREWKDCITHASKSLLEAYRNYDYKKYEKGLFAMGWEGVNIEEELEKIDD
jgi:ribulose 1,5-bisphosphate carboxylase large subunit-like protein